MFRINVALRILLLVVLVLLLVYSYVQTRFYITMMVLLLGIAGVFWSLLNYVDRSNRDMTNFLQGLKFGDFTAVYSGRQKGESFVKLYGAIGEVNQKFQDMAEEKEINHLYLQTIVESVNVGLLCIDQEGGIFLMNKAMKDLLKKPFLHHAEVLGESQPILYRMIESMQSGDREVVKISVQNQLLQLSVQVTEFKIQGNYYKLVALQNIQQELEEQELEAWQKLIRILTHEIMNSVAPIVSLTASMEALFAEERRALSAEEQEDIRQAIGAIQRRSAGLLQFTEAYRNLTRIPTPKFTQVEVASLLEAIATLFRSDLEGEGINFQLELPAQSLSFQADPSLLEQVLINLLKNAIDAVAGQENPQILLRAARNTEQKVMIQVIDNGSGIEPEKIEQIFIPFFTTKNKGTGIGLSLSRQIVRQHKGNLSVQSKPGEGSIFTLSI